MVLGIPYEENQGKVIIDFPSTMSIQLQPSNPCLDLSATTRTIPCTTSGNSITFDTY